MRWKMGKQRTILIVLGMLFVCAMVAVSVWRQEVRAVLRDIRHSTTAPEPQLETLAARFNVQHERILRRKTEGTIDVIFLGDSITEFWKDEGKPVWDAQFDPMNAANFGVSTDTTQNVLWRITDGKEIDGLSPKVVVLMIGTNNTPVNSASAIARGIEKIVRTLRARLPNANILLLSILPREIGGEGLNVKSREVNSIIAKLDDRKTIRYLDISQKFLDANGQPSRELLKDGLHLNTAGYQALADAIRPELDTMLRDR